MTPPSRRMLLAGVTPAVVAEGHRILAETPADWPYLLGYDRPVPDGGETVLTVVRDPLLIVDEHGAGRTAAFASDCSPHWGSPEFMAWGGYGPFWDGLLTWLAAGPETPARG